MKKGMYILFCRRTLSYVLEGVTSKMFSGGEPHTPSFLLFLLQLLFHGYRVLPTVTSSNYYVYRLDSPAPAIDYMNFGFHGHYAPTNVLNRWPLLNRCKSCQARVICSVICARVHLLGVVRCSGKAKGPASPARQDRNIFQFHFQNIH